MNLNKGQFWDTTENAFRGCSRVSKGCEHCWAERFAWRHVHNAKIKHLYTGIVDQKGWTGKLNFNPDWWVRLSHVKTPQKVLFNCMGDLFAGPRVLGATTPEELLNNSDVVQHHEKITMCLNQIRTLHWHLFIVPTKRPPLPALFFDAQNPIKNLVLLASVEDQDAADNRLPYISACRPYVGAVGAICEPLLGHIEIAHHLPGLDWVLVGGETGHKARFMHPFAAGKILQDCRAAGVPFFFKQWGTANRAIHGRAIAGETHNAGPKIWSEWGKQ